MTLTASRTDVVSDFLAFHGLDDVDLESSLADLTLLHWVLSSFFVFVCCFLTEPTLSDCLCWGLTTRIPLWIILCHLPEKGRRDSRRVGHGRKRNRNESEETEEIKTEEIKTFPLYQG